MTESRYLDPGLLSWRNNYRGLMSSERKCPKVLEEETVWVKRLVA